MPEPYVLVDTNVFIWLTRGKAAGARYRPEVENKRMVLCFVTVAELWRGAYQKDYNQESRRRLEAAIGATVVVQPTNELTHRWARVSVEARKMGHALGQPAGAHDAWVAATALHFDVPLLTDDQDFNGFPDLQLVAVGP